MPATEREEQPPCYALPPCHACRSQNKRDALQTNPSEVGAGDHKWIALIGGRENNQTGFVTDASW